jgi:hypothetical protein
MTQDRDETDFLNLATIILIVQGHYFVLSISVITSGCYSSSRISDRLSGLHLNDKRVDRK